MTEELTNLDLILPKPEDHLAEIIVKVMMDTKVGQSYSEVLRAELAKRGGRIVFDEVQS